ncbi:PEGA domain-containing protein [Rhodopseudomonas sp. B29]|uniref:PEGA domain-containing protein n=1 Tax=Rhodopseudomonas sp. B29 TaxID=95607 RepID=UPI0027D80552|nr:PEGA domain-containing protein [Rhodopseudomonas sp. B29]
MQLDSTPQGADALTSTGQSCKTPCSITVPPGDFTVTFSMAKFQPATVPVTVTVTEGSLMSQGTASASPNPVTAELQPAKPVRARKPVHRARKPKAAAPAAEAPAAASPFPAPAAAPAR